MAPRFLPPGLHTLYNPSSEYRQELWVGGGSHSHDTLCYVAGGRLPGISLTWSGDPFKSREFPPADHKERNQRSAPPGVKEESNWYVVKCPWEPHPWALQGESHPSWSTARKRCQSCNHKELCSVFIRCLEVQIKSQPLSLAHWNPEERKSSQLCLHFSPTEL